MFIADTFASEWAPVLSSSHRTIAVEELPAALQQFATISTKQRLTALDSDRLLRPISEAKVLLAVYGLSLHKAASEDGLNNDINNDTSALLLPALVVISNEIINKANLPSSFRAALIIPQQKKGDSDSAMDSLPTNQLQGVC